MSEMTRVEVAGLQLASAVCLIFKYRQSVSTYTLTLAAYEVLSGLLKAQGKQITLDRSGFDPKKIELIKKEIRQLWNRLKHADHEQEDIRWPRLTEVAYVLLLASNDYIEVSGELPPLLRIYQAWFSICFPHAITINGDADIVKNIGEF